MKIPSVYIATPSHDHKFHASFAFALYRLQQAMQGQCRLHLSKVGGAGVARARNNQAQDFLVNTKCDYFFCIDGDIDFTPEQFSRIVAHAMHRDLGNVNGLYPLKDDSALRWCVQPMAGEAMDPETGLQRVASSGTGFKCVHRSVFERMIVAYPEIAYVEDLSEARGVVRWDFFSMGVTGPGSPQSKLQQIELLMDEPHTLEEMRERLGMVLRAKHGPGRYLSEDWYFDIRCGELGIPVYVDCTFHLKHEGIVAFPLQDAFEPQRAPRPTPALWSAEYLAAGLAPDHCADVLAGAYDVAGLDIPSPVILDVGANVGAFARWAAKRWNGATIHCYEPDPANFKLLERTADSIGSSVTCHRLAVLDRDGEAELFRGQHNCGEHSLFDVGEQSAEAVTVQLMSAEQLPRGDILKLDTEGSELRILSALGGAGRLAEFTAILLEYHSEADRQTITGLLSDAGFVLKEHNPRCPERGELKFLRAVH